MSVVRARNATRLITCMLRTMCAACCEATRDVHSRVANNRVVWGRWRGRRGIERCVGRGHARNPTAESQGRSMLHIFMRCLERR